MKSLCNNTQLFSAIGLEKEGTHSSTVAREGFMVDKELNLTFESVIQTLKIFTPFDPANPLKIIQPKQLKMRQNMS